MTKTKTPKDQPSTTLDELKIKIAGIKLNIRSGQEKNTNAHKKLKKQIAQLLTSASSATKSVVTKNTK